MRRTLFGALAAVALLSACGGAASQKSGGIPPSAPTAPAGAARSVPTVRANIAATATSETASEGFGGSTEPLAAAVPAGIEPVVLRTVRAANEFGYDRIVFQFEG